MRGSLASIMEGVRSALMETTPPAAEPHPASWTNALVLGVQQLVTTLRAPGAGGVSIEAMVAAQEAMKASMTSLSAEAVSLTHAARAVSTGAAAGELPAGLSGLLQICLALVAMIVAAVPKRDWKQHAESAPATSGDHVPLRYNVEELQAYFSKRPAIVVQRNAAVLTQLSAFTVAILADWQIGKWEANMPARAKWIRQIMEGLGPAYIKIAQQLSTRVDVIPQVYINELQRLQDNVKVFPTVEARRVLEEGLGRPVDTVFEWLSEDPIAAASLGQVYRGKLRAEWGGSEVAVKVQRPGALESAALDIFVMRRAAILFSMIPGMSDKWAEALDDWASRFFQEMDYQLEAYNTMTFKKHMEGLSGIMVATVYPELTSRKIIVTQWIEGERLADSKTEDVKALCGTLLNCYLIQLLETGLLHADPHPGNLMRTPDGKIVILDFGLMTEVTEDQRIALVEYIAHLTMEDWEGVASDLEKLGFFPEGTKLPPGAEKVIAPVMQLMMGQLVQGGGLGKLNILGLTSQLKDVSINYKLAIPPYFALVIRAFSVIEGIALKVDPKYAIVQECMPYMSRRLLTDNNPRMRAALHKLLYGNSTRLDVDRLAKMISSFTNFSTAPVDTPLATGPTFSAAASSNSNVPARRRDGTLLSGLLTGGADEPVLTEPMKEVLKVVFSKDGSYAQEILVDEAVAAIDAMSREAMGETLRLVTASATTMAALRSVEALGPLRAMLLPLPLPMDMMQSMQPAVALSNEDKQALNTIRALLDLLVPGPGSAGPNVAGMGVRAVRTMGEVAPLLPELLPGLQVTLEMFMRQLVRRMALRLAEDLDTAAKVQAQQRATTAAQGGQYYSPGMTFAQQQAAMQQMGLGGGQAMMGQQAPSPRNPPSPSPRGSSYF